MAGGSTKAKPGRRRRRPRKRRPREPLTWARFWRGLRTYARDTWSRWFTIIGGLAILLTVFHLPGDVSSLRQNADLQQRGRTAQAVVVEVRHEHHSGYRGGSWDEYWPVTEQTVDGDVFTASLRRYSTRDPDLYEHGRRIEVLYDPDHHWTVALAGDDARAALERQVRSASTVGAVGLALVAVGLPVELRRGRRKRRRAETARPLGTARRRPAR